jgi:hypothetical protein
MFSPRCVLLMCVASDALSAGEQMEREMQFFPTPRTIVNSPPLDCLILSHAAAVRRVPIQILFQYHF